MFNFDWTQNVPFLVLLRVLLTVVDLWWVDGILNSELSHIHTENSRWKGISVEIYDQYNRAIAKVAGENAMELEILYAKWLRLLATFELCALTPSGKTLS